MHRQPGDGGSGGAARMITYKSRSKSHHQSTAQHTETHTNTRRTKHKQRKTSEKKRKGRKEEKIGDAQAAAADSLRARTSTATHHSEATGKQQKQSEKHTETTRARKEHNERHARRQTAGDGSGGARGPADADRCTHPDVYEGRANVRRGWLSADSVAARDLSKITKENARTNDRAAGERRRRGGGGRARDAAERCAHAKCTQNSALDPCDDDSSRKRTASACKGGAERKRRRDD